MTIIITGASGMIGRHIAGALQERGTSLRILSHSASSATSRPAGEVCTLPDPDAPLSAFEAAIDGASDIIHCAALNSSRGKGSPQAFLAANATLTEKLAHAAARSTPGRFVFLSSTRAMADGSDNAVLSEGTPCHPTLPYGRSKLEAERLATAAYAKAGRTGVVSLRLPPVYGAGMRGQLGALLKLADTPLPLPLKNFGAPRTLASCDSVVQAVLLMLDHRGPLDPLYMVGDSTPVSVGDILSGFRAGLSRPQRLFSLPEGFIATAASLALQGRTARLLAAGQVVHSQRLAALGWRPQADTPAALAQLAATLRTSSARTS